jgi:hypothetical protein
MRAKDEPLLLDDDRLALAWPAMAPRADFADRVLDEIDRRARQPQRHPRRRPLLLCAAALAAAMILLPFVFHRGDGATEAPSHAAFQLAGYNADLGVTARD